MTVPPPDFLDQKSVIGQRNTVFSGAIPHGDSKCKNFKLRSFHQSETTNTQSTPTLRTLLQMNLGSLYTSLTIIHLLVYHEAADEFVNFFLEAHSFHSADLLFYLLSPHPLRTSLSENDFDP